VGIGGRGAVVDSLAFGSFISDNDILLGFLVSFHFISEYYCFNDSLKRFSPAILFVLLSNYA
jgi:hypothetical protein